MIWTADRKPHPIVVYDEKVRGWFGEIEKEAEVILPWQRVRTLILETGDEVEFSLEIPTFKGRRVLQLKSGASDVGLQLSGQVVTITRGNAEQFPDLKGRKRGVPGNGVLQVVILPEFTGKILLQGE